MRKNQQHTASSDLQTPLPLPEFFPISQQVYLIAIINKTPLRNGNCPITNLITEMGVRKGQIKP